MATVFRAWDMRLSRTVAIKVMHPSLAEDPAFLNRFEREARAAASLSHPHVVSVHDAGRDEATKSVFLVMEYVNGQSLRDVLNARGKLSPNQALGVLDPVLQGLDAAHRAGFIHRDIKPENILIADDGRIKVTDFGLARAAMDGSATAATTSVLIGTVAYIAPEQVTKGYADERSDLYSLGITLFECLTGEVPFKAETPIAVAFAHVHNDVPELSKNVAQGNSSLIAFANKMTSRNPAERFQTSAAALTSLREVRKQIDGYSPVRPPMDFQATEVVPIPSVHTAPAGHSTEQVTTQVELTTPPRKPKSRFRKLLLWLITLSIFVASTYGYMSYRATRTTVPQLIGQELSLATEELETAGLEIYVASEVFDEETAAGIILEATPESGDEVARGTVISVVVSKGPEMYAVPETTGLDLSTAEAAINAAGFKVGEIERAFSQLVPKDSVIASNPSAGELLKPGAEIALQVSDGPAPIAVPDVTGMKLASAQAALTAAGFLSIDVIRNYSDFVSKDSVIRSDPKPAKLKQPDTTIKLYVSDGPPPVAVPQLVGMTKTEALDKLSSLGLIGEIASANTCPKGTSARSKIVQQQLTAAGTMVPKGSTVDILLYVFCA